MKTLCDYCEEATADVEIEEADTGAPIHVCKACLEKIWLAAMLEPEHDEAVKA